MPRIWLDATVDDAEPGPSWRAPVPPIPEVRESLDMSRASPLLFKNGGSGSTRSSNSHGAVEEPHTPTISQRRRRAMPAPLKTTNARPRQRTSARRSHNNASPDVISSLVDSLATISAPANDHFDAIPTLGDAQSRAHSRPLRRVRSDDTQLTDGDAAFAGFSQTHPAATSANNNIATAAVDDAAIPPVIKTAPPPSGLSPLTAPPKPQKAPKESPVRAYFRSGSRTSLHSHRSSDMAHPSPSLDSVVLSKPESPTDSAAPPNISRTNRHKSLSQPASQEQLRQQPSEPPKPVLSLGEDPAYLGPQKSRQKVYIPRKKHTLDPPRQRPIAEEGQGDEIFGAKAAGKQRAKNFSVPGEPSPSVPQRQSSLAQTDGSSNAGSSKASSRKRSGKSEPASIRSTSLHSDVHKPTRGNMMSRIKKKESLKFEDVQDIDSEVVKRIKELKARKELRDREAQNNPQPVQPPERTTSVARHTRSASDPQPPAAVGEDAKVPAALKHLTLGSVAQKRPSSSGVAAAGQSTGVTEAQRLGQAQARSITPATPPNNVEPLPINYKYVMQKLEKAQARDGANATNGDSGTKVRPKSFSLVGRRKHTKTGADVSSGPDSHAGSPRTSMQDGRDDDENSLDFVLSRSTTKKERWSHPGPLKDGRTTKNSRANKEKVDSFAVKAVANAKTGTDGRPSTSHSVDSIDDDVKAFIYAPRLTQKIRHPQSGRTIAFSEVGDPKGYAVFCCVGMGLTRYITAFYDELATTLKLRLITPDRPGVGESQSDPNGTPLSWPDDVVAICQALHIKSFSVMAHSAGAIYALATAMRIPQHIRGKVHLLAPWIPPSQIEAAGMHTETPPTTQLPKAQRFLRVLPTPFLKVANSSFMTATSASLSPKTAGTPTPQNRRKRNPVKPADSQPAIGRNSTSATASPVVHNRRESMMLMDQTMPNGSALSLGHNHNPASPGSPLDPHLVAATTLADAERRREYDAHLTLRIWDLATTNANPAVDLLVCLERTRTIGFRYVDVNRAVVIHHGSKDTRVPLENVKWLGNTMRKCQVRVLEGEGHGLMASAGVMGSVLTEMAAEWEEWSRYTAEKKVEKIVPRKDVGFASARGAATILAS